MFPRLYAIVDATVAGNRVLELAEELVGAGVRLIQYRDKTTSSRRLLETCTALASRLAGRARFIVNDRADVAALCGADGVHVGQDDLGVEEARAICGLERWVGISTHNIEQLCAAVKTSADYVAVGPVFATGTKKNPDPVVGLELIAQAKSLTQKPIVAIGGITLENAELVYRAGADSLAVIRDLLASGNAAERAAEYLRL